jgi:hypothetical protein
VKKLLFLLVLVCCAELAHAQDIEPRRWAQMPTGLNFIGLGLNYSSGDIQFDPLLRIEDGEVESTGGALVYIRSFDWLGRSARVDFQAPYASTHWQGLLNEEPTSLHRHGFADPRVRISMLLKGGPAQTPAEFATTPQANTVVGVAVAVTLPLGHYVDDRLLNISGNRWVVRPQLGVTHSRGPWSYELTASVFLYGDNDRFYQRSLLETDPLWALQGHLIYNIKPGLWVSLSSAYGVGADSRVNGVDKKNEVGNWLFAASMGLPLSRTQGLKVTLLRASTQRLTGADIDSVLVGWSMMF